MSYSKLATTVIWSPHCNKPRNHTIDSVAIHTMAGNLTVEGCGSWFTDPSAGASSNYGIDSSGHIGVYVDESNRSWCTSSRGVDHRSVTIEVASTTRSEPYECTSQAYEALITLLVDICQRNKIPALRWKADKNYAIQAAAGGSVSEQNMFVHRWFEPDKSCPGEYLYNRMGQIANEVNKRLGSSANNSISFPVSEGVQSMGQIAGVAGGTSQVVVASSKISSAWSVTTDQFVDINYEEYNPYLVTLTRDSKIQYSKLKDASVIGAVVEAGAYTHSNHVRTETFMNPNLPTQIKALNNVDMYYGLFTYGRARSRKEADDEMFQFSFPLRMYPPKLGAWIQLELGKNKSINNDIMERYYKNLLRLGFHDKMGIIATPLQLSYIDWDEYQDKFFLWSVNHVSSLDELDKLLDPEFFDMDEQLEFYKEGKSVLQTA